MIISLNRLLSSSALLDEIGIRIQMERNGPPPLMNHKEAICEDRSSSECLTKGGLKRTPFMNHKDT